MCMCVKVVEMAEEIAEFWRENVRVRRRCPHSWRACKIPQLRFWGVTFDRAIFWDQENVFCVLIFCVLKINTISKRVRDLLDLENVRTFTFKTFPRYSRERAFQRVLNGAVSGHPAMYTWKEVRPYTCANGVVFAAMVTLVHACL